MALLPDRNAGPRYEFGIFAADWSERGTLPGPAPA